NRPAAPGRERGQRRSRDADQDGLERDAGAGGRDERRGAGGAGPGQGIVLPAHRRAQSLVRRLPHARARRQQVPGRPDARRRDRGTHAPLPDVAHQSGRRLGHAPALPVVHDAARRQHAGRRRHRVRRARALPDAVRHRQAALPPRARALALPCHPAPGAPEASTYTHRAFAELAARYGRLGGYAHLATLVRRIREERPGRTLLLDGGDTLQGSATALWSRGEDMVRAMNLLGVEVATAHWEFMYGIERVRELFGDAERRGLFAGDFVAQNVSEAGFGDRIFKPYTVRHVGGVNVAVIGQAFPYTVVAHPKRLVGDLTFGIREDQVQALIDEARDRGKADIVVLLSHNGISVDLKLAA